MKPLVDDDLLVEFVVVEVVSIVSVVLVVEVVVVVVVAVVVGLAVVGLAVEDTNGFLQGIGLVIGVKLRFTGSFGAEL